MAPLALCALDLHACELGTFILAGIHVLDNIQADRDSGIVNYGDGADGEGMVAKQRVLILLLEQEILFIDLSSFPE